jgi:hypothetical protein
MESITTITSNANIANIGNLGGWPIWTTRDWKYANVKWTTTTTRIRANVKPLQTTWNGENRATYKLKQHATSQCGVLTHPQAP